MDILGEIGVRLRAIGDTFKDEAEKQVKQATPKAVEIPLTVADLSPAQKAAIEAAGGARASLAATRRELDAVEKKLVEFASARKQAEAAGGPILEAFRRREAEFAKNPTATDEAPLKKRAEALRIMVFLEEQAAAAAAARAREQIKADQAAAASASGGGGRPGVRQLTAGRTGGLGGLLAAGSRLGLIGFAATAAFQAVGELQSALRVTGDEAFTAEGKLRNLGAELLGGNIIGGIKAITATRKAEFSGQLGDAIEAQIAKERAAKDPLVITEQKLDLVRQKGRKTLELYVASLEASGRINEKQAKAILEVSDKMEAQKTIVEAAATSWANYQAAVEKAGSELKAFGPDSRGGALGVGGVAAGAPKGGTSPVFRAGSGGTDVAAQIRASINSRIQDEQTIANARVREATIQRKIAKDSFDRAKENVQAGVAAAHSAADEWQKYVDATTGVVLATQNAEQVAKTAAAAGEALGDAVRDAQVAAIPDPNLRATAELNALRIKERNAKRAFEAAEKGTKEANEAYGKWKIAQAATAGQQAAIAENARQTAQSAREASLANDIAAAELTGDIPKLRKAYQASIAYWRSVANNTKLAADVREAAEGTVISLTASLKGVGNSLKVAKLQNALAEAELKGLDTRPFLEALRRYAFQQMSAAKVGTETYETLRATYLAAAQAVKSGNQTLNNLKLANREARALLTDTQNDEEKLYREQIAYWKRRAKATRGEGEVHQQAIAEQLKWEAKLKGLVEDIKPTTTVFDLLTKSTERFNEFAGNVINAANRFTSDSFTGGIRGQIGTQPNAAGRARLGLEDQTTAVNNNTTALDRNTQAIIAAGRSVGTSGVSTGAVQPPGAIDQGAVVGARYNAMARAYAEHARAARNGIS